MAKYGQKGFHLDYWFLFQLPKNSKEAKRQLNTLHELGVHRNDPAFVDMFNYHKFSKRHERIEKTYWAFRRMEARA